ncbi:hypothetical protein CapIbe_005445 [Capra ibex]
MNFAVLVREINIKFQRCLAVAASLESERRKRRKTVALQAPPCMGFSRKNTGVGSPADLSDPGIKCLLSPALAGLCTWSVAVRLLCGDVLFRVL